jgi:hypothetical protein
VHDMKAIFQQSSGLYTEVLTGSQRFSSTSKLVRGVQVLYLSGVPASFVTPAPDNDAYSGCRIVRKWQDHFLKRCVPQLIGAAGPLSQILSSNLVPPPFSRWSSKLHLHQPYPHWLTHSFAHSADHNSLLLEDVHKVRVTNVNTRRLPAACPLSACPLVGRSVGRSAGRPVGRSTVRSVRRFIGRPAGC